jgi:hypothetical protein
VDPRTIQIVLYCSNKILPNEKLGRIAIPRDQFSKGRTTTRQIPVEPHGDLSLNIPERGKGERVCGAFFGLDASSVLPRVKHLLLLSSFSFQGATEIST